MTTALAVSAVIWCAAALACGLASDTRLTAVTVAAYRVRYAAGPAEAATGLAVTAAAAGACVLGGTAYLITFAARRACEAADRAACRTITRT
jgi:hypothetical protein